MTDFIELRIDETPTRRVLIAVDSIVKVEEREGFYGGGAAITYRDSSSRSRFLDVIESYEEVMKRIIQTTDEEKQV